MLNKPKQVAIAAEISFDRTRTSIVAAGRGEDGRIVVELTEYLPGTNHAGAIADLVGRWPPRGVTAVILDPRSPSATLLEPLKALGRGGFRVFGTGRPDPPRRPLVGVDIIEASSHVMAAAHGCFLDELRAGRLVVAKHPALDAAAKYAQSRQLAGGEGLERRKPDIDTGPIVAAELAVWAVLNVKPKSRPRVFAAGPDGKILSREQAAAAEKRVST